MGKAVIENKYLKRFFNPDIISQEEIYDIELDLNIQTKSSLITLLDEDFSDLDIPIIPDLKLGWLLGVSGPKRKDVIQKHIKSNYTINRTKRVLSYGFVHQDYRDLMYELTGDIVYANKIIQTIFMP